MIPEYITNIPDIGEQIIEVAIQRLLDNTSRTTKTLRNFKRTLPENDTPKPPKKEKNYEKHHQKNLKSPSKKEGQPTKMKSLKLIKTKKDYAKQFEQDIYYAYLIITLQIVYAVTLTVYVQTHVANLSKRHLSSTHILLLSKGLSFVPMPKDSGHFELLKDFVREDWISLKI